MVRQCYQNSTYTLYRGRTLIYRCCLVMCHIRYKEDDTGPIYRSESLERDDIDGYPYYSYLFY